MTNCPNCQAALRTGARFCGNCGKALIVMEIGDEGPTPCCDPCGRVFLDLPKIGVLVLAVRNRRDVVLLKQDDVSTTHWVLPAGYVKSGETAEETVARETLEETGLTVTAARYVASYTFEKAGEGHLLLGFHAEVEGRLHTESQEVQDAMWAPFGEVEAHLRPGSIGSTHLRNVRVLLETV